MAARGAVLAIAAGLLAAAGCGGGESTSAWCEQFEQAARAITDASAAPNDQDALERAGRELRDLRGLTPPGEVADEFRILTSELPPRLTGRTGTAEDRRYREALGRMVRFLRSECGIDPRELEAFTAV